MTMVSNYSYFQMCHIAFVDFANLGMVHVYNVYHCFTLKLYLSSHDVISIRYIHFNIM